MAIISLNNSILDASKVKWIGQVQFAQSLFKECNVNYRAETEILSREFLIEKFSLPDDMLLKKTLLCY